MLQAQALFLKQHIMNAAEIAKRVDNKQRVTPAEYAYLLSQDRKAFFKFLTANNPGSMNDILRHKLGYTFELNFTPDQNKINRIVEMILQRNNQAEIKTILNNFQLNKAGISKELWAQLNDKLNY